ncbi:acyl-CoA carboxylase subunit epsilon [Actinosynnema sp. NPDC059335]|uniref:acyl-CoA carboxylase subunit epsilon n=1 Tax=Actinosynnema sp. NPDC059335 TaxID=3346804 RepID=UPI00367113FB
MTASRPRLVVLRGEPDDVELAAVVIALLALAGDQAGTAEDTDPAGANWLIPAWFTPPGSWPAR